jgi:hypothetical protein
MSEASYKSNLARKETLQLLRVSRSQSMFKRIRVTLVTLLCVTAAGAAGDSSNATKAAFLYRFAAYIDWPDDAPLEDGPFVIAVAGDEGVARQLELQLPRKTVHGRTAEVRRVRRVADLGGANVLFVGAGEFKRTRALRTAALAKPILIVTDDEAGIDGGAVINFLEDHDNVRFEISLIAADRARLKVDAALLAVAARVERRPQATAE